MDEFTWWCVAGFLAFVVPFIIGAIFSMAAHNKHSDLVVMGIASAGFINPETHNERVRELKSLQRKFVFGLYGGLCTGLLGAVTVIVLYYVTH